MARLIQMCSVFVSLSVLVAIVSSEDTCAAGVACPTSAVEAQEERESTGARVELLQSSHHQGRRTVASTADQEKVVSATDARNSTPPVVLNASKVSWLHIPKTGTSFANTLVTWGCPSLDNHAYVGEHHPDGGKGEYLKEFMYDHRSECKTGFSLCGGHLPIGVPKCTDLKTHSASLVGMFRQPEQRIMSGYYNGYHSMDYDPAKPPTLSEYARYVVGCSVHMMTGRGCGSQHVIDEQDLEVALMRLDDAFAFVGITEEWNLSACLFHAMFGSDIHYRELLNVRPGNESTKGEAYDTTALDGFIDEWDGRLYDHAYNIFWSSIRHFGVTREACSVAISDAW
jgi:hypothetical protein